MSPPQPGADDHVLEGCLVRNAAVVCRAWSSISRFSICCCKSLSRADISAIRCPWKHARPACTKPKNYGDSSHQHFFLEFKVCSFQFFPPCGKANIIAALDHDNEPLVYSPIMPVALSLVGAIPRPFFGPILLN